MSSLGWVLVAGLCLVALVLLAFLADSMWLALQWLVFAWRHPEERAKYWVREIVAEAWTLTLYKWLPTPRVRLSGVRPSLVELYDGQILERTAHWWNELMRKRPGFVRRTSAREIDASALAAISSKLERLNRAPMVARAASLAPHGQLAEGAYALAYCLARVFAAGSDSDWQQEPQQLTLEQVVENDRNYDQVGLYVSDFSGVPREGFWRELEIRSLWNQLTISAIRWAYRDQVRRWEKAEGVSMGKGVGFAPLEELKLVERFDDLLFEHGGRFFETETAIEALYREAARSRSSF